MEDTTIQNRIGLMEKLAEEIRIAKEALKAELDNDEQYVEESLSSKEANARKKASRDKVFANESCQKLLEDIKANNEEVSILMEILATELMEVYSEKKVNEIEDAEGEFRKFILSVKLLPKKMNFNKKKSGFGK